MYFLQSRTQGWKAKRSKGGPSGGVVSVPSHHKEGSFQRRSIRLKKGIPRGRGKKKSEKRKGRELPIFHWMQSHKNRDLEGKEPERGLKEERVENGRLNY